MRNANRKRRFGDAQPSPYVAGNSACRDVVPVGAEITHGLDSLVLTFLRFALAALLFAPIVAWRYGLALPSLRDLARYGVLSACLVGFFWGMFAALRLTSVLNTAAIFALVPVITATVSAVLLRERLSRAARFALPLGMIGAIWVIFRGDPTALISLDLGMGDGIFLAGTIAMGFYGPLIKYLHRGEPMAQMTFWTLATGALWLLLLSAPRLSGVEWDAVPITVYGGIAYLAVFTTLVTFFVIQWSSTVIVLRKSVRTPISIRLWSSSLAWRLVKGFRHSQRIRGFSLLQLRQLSCSGPSRPRFRAWRSDMGREPDVLRSGKRGAHRATPFPK